MSDTQDVSFRDPSVEFSFLERYKGHVGQKDRLAIVSQTFVRGFQHFHNQKKFICLTESADKPKICCTTIGPSRQYFSGLVWHYVTDPEGNPIAKDKPFLGKLKVWVFPESRYQELGTLDGQWPLTDKGFGKPQHDLLITTTDNTFQKMTFVPTPEAFWKVSGEAIYKKIFEKAFTAKPQAVKALGNRLSEQEVMALLGKAPATNPASSLADANEFFAGTTSVPQAQNTDIDLSDLLK